MAQPPPSLRGRGVVDNPANRFERLWLDVDPTEAGDGSIEPRVEPTLFFRDTARSVISRNDSPDIPFETSLNPYRGCEHGCVYCYARPTHEYLGFSCGLDFETRIFVKEDAPELLRDELCRRSWIPQALALSGVTDPYQPIERRLRLTRRCLEVLVEARNPVSLITKSALVVRDADLLADLARHRAASVALSVTTLDDDLRRRLEPRAASADLRFDAIARLREAGVPAGVSVAPVIPGLNDHEMPRILARAAEAGASFASYIVLRLPNGVTDLFQGWLDRHAPDRKARVLSRVRDVREGRLSDACFGSRMRGEGPVADLLADVFRVARERAGIPARESELSTEAFRRPSAQRSLFG
jgi:DNA repair photolyase